ncbi:MAG: histidine kinase dimerization/phospho-acceptor domain-containing protein, partial [Ktedonobacteraceae bacterium]
MIEPERTLQEVLISEATTTLVDLAKLSQRAGMVSGDAFPGVANEMLVRLLLACHARQGAILLIAPGEPSDEQPTQRPEQVKDPRIFTLHGMRAEEVHSLLRIGSPTTQESGQITHALPCWITYRQPLINGQSGQSLLALLVLGWAGLEHDFCADAMAWGQQMLPFLIDAVASVIVTMLQAERLNELEQRSTRESLEKMNLLKAELLATISHELRSPLASIKGYAALLLRYERRLRREERHQFLLTINEGTVRLERIVESLLEISQLETEGITLQVSPVNVPLLVQEAMRAAEERLSAQLAGRFSFSLQVEDRDGRLDANIPWL